MSINLMKIKDIKNDSKKINIEVKLIKKLAERSVTNKKTRLQQKVADFLIGDETGVYTLTMWDADINKIDNLKGKVILIKNGYINVFMDQGKLNIGKYGAWEISDKEIDVAEIPEEEPKEIKWSKIKELREGMKNVNIIIKIGEKAEPRSVSFKDGTMHRVATAEVGDETGIIRMSLFDNMIEEVGEGEIYELKNGYISKFQDNLQLNIGKFGEFKKTDHEDFEINKEIIK